MAAALALCAFAEAALAQPPATAATNNYGDPEAWLCLPGHKGACDANLDATVVAADGTLTVERFRRDPAPEVDCFYLYPTVSRDPTGNSDMRPGPEEFVMVTVQFARFGAVCRTFAPLYRSATLSAVMGGQPTTPADRELSYRDVRAAWRYYLDHHNRGRGVVLIGHSQGAGLLARLIGEELDGKPAARRLVSAVLAGLPGRSSFGDFRTIPNCTMPDQTGCVVRYASFRATEPPPADAIFGRSGGGHPAVACVNPAALGSEAWAELHPYFPARNITRHGAPWVAGGPAVQTAFVSLPGLFAARCERRGPIHYLSIESRGDPADPRVDELGADMVIAGERDYRWGWHAVDILVAQGDLIAMIGRQAAAFHR